MPERAAARNPTPILVVLLLAGVSFALSQTMVVPALPALSEELGASPSATSWILTGYLLSASVATPLAGKLGDLFGKGRVLTGVLLLFALGSIVCATAGSIEQAIAGRVIQGVAGGVFPLSFGIIRDTFPRERVAGGIGLLSAVFGIGGGIGLPLSGVVVDNFDLSLIFWIGLLALPAALAAHRLVPPSPTARRTRIDWAGAALLSSGLVAVLLGVTEANQWGWTSPGTLGLIVGGVALLVVWVLVERRVDEPLVDLRVLRTRAVAMTNLAGALVGFAMFATFLLLPQFAQADESTGYGFGMSVTESGLLLVPLAGAQLLAGLAAGRIAGRIGFRMMLLVGALLATVAFTALAFEHAHPWQIVIAGALFGAGLSLALGGMANLIVEAVPQSDVGVATGINTITRTVGGAFGSAVAVAILTADTIGSSAVPSEHAYTLAFAIAALFALLAAGAAVLVPARRGGGGEPPAAPAPAKG
ncbi:MAG TPA: MFS transporter [Capillimicrobium sp.]|jgi:EmrB/QacA subfamily drug resistance transporter